MKKYFITSILVSVGTLELFAQTEPAIAQRYGAPDKPKPAPVSAKPLAPVKIATNQPPATNAVAASRLALIRAVNDNWKTERSIVEKTVSFQQIDAIQFGERGGKANVHCTLAAGRTQPDWFILHFQRRGDRTIWEDYRRTVLNIGGKVTDLTPKDCKVELLGNHYLEQMSIGMSDEEFRQLARQTELPISVAGEEFVLTQHTLTKWRTLLAYFDQNQTNAPVAKP